MWIYYDCLSYDVENMFKDLPSYVLNTKFNAECKIPYLYVEVDTLYEGNMLIFSDKYFRFNKDVLSHFQAPAREINVTIEDKDINLLVDSPLYKRVRDIKRVPNGMSILVSYENFHEDKPWFAESIPRIK